MISAATAIYMLEIFVAFLQAYVFTFLTAVFMGMAAHPDPAISATAHGPAIQAISSTTNRRPPEA